MNSFSRDAKIITVSGLYSGIGKTLLCERIIALADGIAAVKVTITDTVTAVHDDDETLLITGKDTCRLKDAGASKIVWVRSTAENLGEALGEALQLVSGFSRILIEGNSILEHLTPDLAIFLCDGRLLEDNRLKPSRIRALSKAHLIVNNIRPPRQTASAELKKKIRETNRSAPVVSLNLSDATASALEIKRLLTQNGFI